MHRILPFLLFLGLGVLLKRLPVFPKETDRSLEDQEILHALNEYEEKIDQ